MGFVNVTSASASMFLWLAMFVAAFLPVTVMTLWSIWKRRRNARRSPLTASLHHLPGESVGRQAEVLYEQGSDRLALSVAIGPVVVATWAFGNVDLRTVHFGWLEGTLLAGVLVVSFGAAWSALKFAGKRRQYLEGRAAERATAQRLVPLIAKGCAIYNDIPGDGFNLDHVVIGPDAVYMIETKSRRKPRERGKHSAQVVFDGLTLRFPDWREAKVLDQARAQTRWLADYLYRKLGERVRVEPVLALPGWYVTRTVSVTDVHVINPGMHNFMADCRHARMPEPKRRRIMTALEERYGVEGVG